MAVVDEARDVLSLVLEDEHCRVGLRGRRATAPSGTGARRGHAAQEGRAEHQEHLAGRRRPAAARLGLLAAPADLGHEPGQHGQRGPAVQARPSHVPQPEPLVSRLPLARLRSGARLGLQRVRERLILKAAGGLHNSRLPRARRRPDRRAAPPVLALKAPPKLCQQPRWAPAPTSARPRTPRFSGPAPCGTSGAAPRLWRRAPGESPAAGLAGEGRLNRYPPFSGSSLGPYFPLPRPRLRWVRGQRRGPRASAGRRRFQRCRAVAAAALAPGGHWEAGRGMGCAPEGVTWGGADSYQGDQLSPGRSGLPGSGAIGSLGGPARTISMENNKNKTWPRGGRSSSGRRSPARCSSSNCSRPSLASSFLPGCFFNRAATPPPVRRAESGAYKSLSVKSPLRLFLRPRSQTAPPTRPSGSNTAPGAGTVRTNSSSPGSPISPSSSGRLCCPLERGPLSTGRWDFFFFN